MKLLLLAASLLFSSKTTPATQAITPNASFSLTSSAELLPLCGGVLLTHWTLSKKERYKISRTNNLRKAQWGKKIAPILGLLGAFIALPPAIVVSRIGSYTDQIGPISYARIFTKVALGMTMYGAYRLIYESSRGHRTIIKREIKGKTRRSNRWITLSFTKLGITAIAFGCYLAGK